MSIKTMPEHRLELCQAARSQLIIVDVQERLCAAMPQDCLEQIGANINRLSHAAQLLEVPLLVTEQYPKGLGPTRASILSVLPEGLGVCEKTTFSCCGTPGFENNLGDKSERPQVILAGMETHICVLQTAAGLQHWGYRVFVIADAVCSRNPKNRDNALNRMSQGGITVTNTESVVFEWLGSSAHERFKEVSRLFR